LPTVIGADTDRGILGRGVAEMNYDPQVIETMAARLYSQASRLVLFGLLLGAVVGGLGGFVGALWLGMEPLLLAGVGALLGGAIGAAAMEQPALALKFQAQIALCQVQIEKNTRK
jgi:hypothetical protein